MPAGEVAPAVAEGWTVEVLETVTAAAAFWLAATVELALVPVAATDPETADADAAAALIAPDAATPDATLAAVVALLLLALVVEALWEVVEVRLTAEVGWPTATVPVTVARPSAMHSLTNEL